MLNEGVDLRQLCFQLIYAGLYQNMSAESFWACLREHLQAAFCLFKHFSHENIKAGNEGLLALQTAISCMVITIQVCWAAEINTLPHIPYSWLHLRLYLTKHKLHSSVALFQCSVLNPSKWPMWTAFLGIIGAQLMWNEFQRVVCLILCLD